MNLTSILDGLIGREGKFSDNPDDRGNYYNGKLEGTMWGITPAVARSFGYRGAMRDMERSMAVAIYKDRYWFGPKFDQVDTVDDKIAVRLLDIGVNAGQTTGVKFLQRALNVLNRQGSDFPDVAVDGVIGPMTLKSMRQFIAKRGQEGRKALLFMIAAQHSVYYMEIAEKRPANETFMYGWITQRAMEGISL